MPIVMNDSCILDGLQAHISGAAQPQDLPGLVQWLGRVVEGEESSRQRAQFPQRAVLVLVLPVVVHLGEFAFPPGSEVEQVHAKRPCTVLAVVGASGEQGRGEVEVRPETMKRLSTSLHRQIHGSVHGNLHEGMTAVSGGMPAMVGRGGK